MIISIARRANVLAPLTAVLVSLAISAPMQTLASDSPGPLTVHADQSGPVINRDIFGQFAEHLGQGIYGGIWVGKDSKIPNVRGIRSDVVAALRAIKVPVVRWPGGCFADEYHWRDGVGPAGKRVTTVNTNWAGASEPNTFGTDEFMDFARQIGSEAYISVNVGSGTVQEARDWLDYMTAVPPASAAKERAANGHAEPYKVKYVGIGNEMWGCGGPYTGEEYVTKMKTFAHFLQSRNPDQAPPRIDFAAIAKDLMAGKPMDGLPKNPEGMRRIAAGPNSSDPSYTEIIMQAWKTRSPIYWDIDGISLHQYTWGPTPFNEPATGFGEKEYATLLMHAGSIDRTLSKHSGIMDKYDPDKAVALVVDEWGVWLKPNEGTEPMFLQQQNSLRDAIVAATHLNIFARHADRVRMTNIAQMVNVLQAMILTDKDMMLLTPTYHVFKMYVPFQDAQFIPISFDTGTYTFGDISLQQVDAIAARGKDGKIWLALANLDANQSVDIAIDVPGVSASSAVGEVLSAERFDAINTFDAPDAVAPKPISAQAVDGKLVLPLPPHSVTVVRLEL